MAERSEPVNVVIGAASGMGAAVASLLAPRGPLLVADRDADRLTDVAAGLGAGVTAMARDVTVPADVHDLRDATGRLGALVVTAGVCFGSMAGGRIGRPQEVASIAAFLVSEAASFLTGIDVLVDGGATAALVP